ncbi:hypothetical protein ACFP9V_22620 [Deinococcus radiopugnans]|uniref:Uncharacterized protein n=1 Tax=Deinococcus radiopugnans ATCC 19172 TaxID=585398 RepID=A0A5C4Y4A9_9DEIO|nr:hypothetical protein [Deinococcus radiopugnans]MBB6017058.1 hypothetical protein [Deinococcus radiopugnans ATCC 19172]TNM70707.1 hypothetical protein FHR04_12470 [Deinococcus radiopugnans ATCC 19172]
MKRRGAILLLVLATTSAQQPKFETTTDLNAVLGLMKGQVDLYGDRFGTVAFERGILTLVQSKAIIVRVLTNPASAPNMRPLKNVGARVFTLPSRFTGGMVIVRGKAVIIPTGNGFNVLKTATEVGQIQGLMEQYWAGAKPY